MEINPGVIVQSSLALVVAMTTIDTLKSGIAMIEPEMPTDAFKYRLVVLAMVITVVVLIIYLLPKVEKVEKEIMDLGATTGSTASIGSTTSIDETPIPINAFIARKETFAKCPYVISWDSTDEA